MNLSEQKCVACRRDSPSVPPEEVKELLPQISEWELIEVNEIPRLHRVFKFSNFADSLEFTNKVGALAEEEGHHPLLTTEWGRVRVQWWTHKIRNLHQNDFIMSSKTDDIFNAS